MLLETVGCPCFWSSGSFSGFNFSSSLESKQGKQPISRNQTHHTKREKKNKNQIFQILIKKINFFSHTQSTVNIPNNNPIWVQTTFTIYPLSTKQMNPTRTEGNKNNFKLIKGKSLWANAESRLCLRLR